MALLSDDFMEKLLSLDTQMKATSLLIVANLLTLATLQGAKEQQSGCKPCKDYSFMEAFPHINTTLVLIASIYFFYLSYTEYKEHPHNAIQSALMLLETISTIGSVIRFDLSNIHPELNDTDQSQALEQELLIEESTL